ncbi:MAG: hypothetical protein V1494_02260 [Candidatus Diapherotrites archaeon]
MLGFILSKINLLILVISVFAIVTFFLFGLSDIVKVEEMKLLLNRAVKLSDSLVAAPTLCESAYHYLPNYIRLLGDDFYYVMRVSRQQLELENGEYVNYLIFSVMSRKDYQQAVKEGKEPNSIAANSFRTSADVRIWSKVDDEWGVVDSAIIDPQAALPDTRNAFVFVKEIVGGKATLYVIPCNAQICEEAKTSVGEIIHPDIADLEGGFHC